MSLKADLLRREAYGSLAPTGVELAETHISWVFLLERDVFKVKKPVNLGFLDFTTLEQRRTACVAEVRLNSRLAPEVYRGVVPVHLTDSGRYTVVGDGPVVDWAVHMRRLPDGQRADRLVTEGMLSGDVVEAVARHLAAFHARGASTPEVARHGAPGAVRFNVEENFAQTADTIEQFLGPGDAEELRRWQSDFLREHGALFEERVRSGRIRDGHGDLHLDHVYVDGNEGVTIIDCIEFNDRFRFADVCADVAFLAMDLAAHRRVDLAERFIAAYARESNDFDLYALVDFYESYRAFIRGKVATLLATDADVDAATRAHAREDARRHYLLALSADRRALLRPSVVAVGGVIASGKSTVAARLGSELAAPVIEADRTRKDMIGVEATRRIEDGAWQGAYDVAFTDRVYDEVFRRAGVVLASGRPVVLDASFRSSALRDAARTLSRAHGVPFMFVECQASAARCRERLLEREVSGGISDGRLEIFDAFCARFQPVTELPAAEHVTVDTTRPIERTLEALRERVDAWPRGLVA